MEHNIHAFPRPYSLSAIPIMPFRKHRVMGVPEGLQFHVAKLSRY